MPGQLEALDILYLALAEPIGLVLRVSDREGARQRLYQARAKASDTALSELQIRVSPFDEGDLVVCHQRILVTGKGQKWLDKVEG